MSEPAPQLHIDTDWKAQAQAEKERLAVQVEAKQAAEQERRGAAELPPANFQTLVSMIAEQAIMGLGAMQDPKSGRVVVDLEGARFSIDLLGVIEEKSKGNLSEEESHTLRELLGALRSRYVQFVKMVNEQLAARGAAGGIAESAAAAAPTRTTPGGLHIPGA
jgi:hypothetical protein